MAEGLDEFPLYERADSVVPTAEFEGTNASRFANSLTLSADTRNSTLRSLDIDPLHTFKRFGCNPEIALLGAAGDPAKQGYVEARIYIDVYSDGWSSEEVRARASRDLNGRNT